MMDKYILCVCHHIPINKTFSGIAKDGVGQERACLTPSGIVINTLPQDLKPVIPTKQGLQLR